MDAWKKTVKTGAISESMNFNSLADNPSGPVALWILRPWSSLSTPVFPIVTVQVSSYVCIEGNAVTLGCTVYPRLPENIVFWKKLIIDGHLENITSPHSGSTATVPSLTILNATIDDMGFYICFASNSVGTGQSNMTYLIVSDITLSVQVEQASYLVTIGSTVTLVCTVTGFLPVSNVYWQRNINGLLTQITSSTNNTKHSGSTPGTPSLTIFNADQSDAGSYTCLATNEEGTGHSTTTTLSVTETANVTITELTSEGKMATGRNVTVTCKAYISPPKDSVFVVWMLNDAIINPTYSSRWISKIIQSNNFERWEFRLTVINIETSDSGLLTCVVGDGFVFSEETLVLNVIGKPTVDISPRTATAILGDIVNINCTVVYSFSVTTSILWYKNGQTFNGNTGEFITHADNAHATLVIYGIQNAAQYACSGINIYGEGDRLTSHITVMNPDNVYQYCPSDVDQFGSNWEISIENAIAIKPCPGNRTGTTSRFCNSYGEWEEPNYSSCISKDLLNLTLQSELLKNGVEIKDVNSILLDLNNITDIREDLTSGELETSSEILDNIAYFIEERTANLSVDQLENLKGVTRIAKAVTVYTKAYTKVNSSGFQRTVQKD
ncbi:Hypothetical predicted protein [Mytilus galloprovincialis]|uniref:HMCN n=1 Tax=Mytilus galloprovincialis TaxID=29158 RepID=A0A8B6CQL8_MYTGA|nr:Hypothetical predicted protein [Mytilus galloprovincialis]